MSFLVGLIGLVVVMSMLLCDMLIFCLRWIVMVWFVNVCVIVVVLLGIGVMILVIVVVWFDGSMMILLLIFILFDLIWFM